jgi:hypoxanthine phosphoribosyltransferase
MESSKHRSLSKGSKKEFLTWETYFLYLHLLENKIRESTFKVDYVYGIPRGGIIPAVILSHEFNVELLLNNSKFKKGDKLLIIDDICDTGKTLKPYTLLNRKMVKTAVILKHKNSTIIPDYYIKENDNWIVFPYEKE